MSEAIVDPVVRPHVRQLCKTPYPNHRRGCPNYGTKNGCPPDAPIISNVIDIERPVWAIYNVFPIGKHIEKMRIKHPEWSQRQLTCCLYWQGTARKQLRVLVRQFLQRHPDYHVVGCPEAQGVNVTATMQGVGIALEWPPLIYAYQIVLAGRKREAVE